MNDEKLPFGLRTYRNVGYLFLVLAVGWIAIAVVHFVRAENSRGIFDILLGLGSVVVAVLNLRRWSKSANP